MLPAGEANASASTYLEAAELAADADGWPVAADAHGARCHVSRQRRTRPGRRGLQGCHRRRSAGVDRASSDRGSAAAWSEAVEIGTGGRAEARAGSPGRRGARSTGRRRGRRTPAERTSPTADPFRAVAQRAPDAGEIDSPGTTGPAGSRVRCGRLLRTCAAPGGNLPADPCPLYKGRADAFEPPPHHREDPPPRRRPG